MRDEDVETPALSVWVCTVTSTLPLSQMHFVSLVTAEYRDARGWLDKALEWAEDNGDAEVTRYGDAIEVATEVSPGTYQFESYQIHRRDLFGVVKI